MALDGSGNLYIADTDNNRIRKVSATGVITTVAGTATAGFSGDGAAATAAQLSIPTDVALDGAGNLYIVDNNNHRIRKVDSAGVITTVAGTGTADTQGRIRGGFSGDGGAATAAQLAYPRKVALDGAGNLYIADSGNDRIRKVSATGVITTVAGTGMAGFSGDGGAATAAQLYSPYGVALDGAGNLYFADNRNERIRKVDSAGVITTVAGTGIYGFSGDGGAATAAQLNSPYGVALDGSGNLYIADTSNQRIRKVDSAGVITTVAGSGIFGFGGDGGAAVAAQLKLPFGVAVDGAGNLYIADNRNDRIRKAGPQTLPALPAAIAPPPPPIVLIAPDPPPDPAREDPPVTGPTPDPRPREPAARARTLELAFVLRQDDAPAAQQVVLYAASGDVDFRAQPAQRWIAVAPASGSLREDEEAAVMVTVDPAGLRVGRREGLVYVRSGGRVTARVRIALTVQPPAGPAVSEHGVVNAAVLSAFGERELFGSRLLPVAPGVAGGGEGREFHRRRSVCGAGFPAADESGRGHCEIRRPGGAAVRGGAAAHRSAVTLAVGQGSDRGGRDRSGDGGGGDGRRQQLSAALLDGASGAGDFHPVGGWNGSGGGGAGGHDGAGGAARIQRGYPLGAARRDGEFLHHEPAGAGRGHAGDLRHGTGLGGAAVGRRDELVLAAECLPGRFFQRDAAAYDGAAAGVDRRRGSSRGRRAVFGLGADAGGGGHGGGGSSRGHRAVRRGGGGHRRRRQREPSRRHHCRRMSSAVEHSARSRSRRASAGASQA